MDKLITGLIDGHKQASIVKGHWKWKQIQEDTPVFLQTLHEGEEFNL